MIKIWALPCQFEVLGQHVNDRDKLWQNIKRKMYVGNHNRKTFDSLLASSIKYQINMSDSWFNKA